MLTLRIALGVALFIALSISALMTQAALALPGAAALRGGVPLSHQGRVIGSIGISGDSPTVDEEISVASAAALAVN